MNTAKKVIKNNNICNLDPENLYPLFYNELTFLQRRIAPVKLTVEQYSAFKKLMDENPEFKLNCRMYYDDATLSPDKKEQILQFLAFKLVDFVLAMFTEKFIDTRKEFNTEYALFMKAYKTGGSRRNYKRKSSRKCIKRKSRRTHKRTA
jgi:hypothetical protein